MLQQILIEGFSGFLVGFYRVWGFIGDEYENRQGATEASRRVSGFRVCGASGFGILGLRVSGLGCQVLCEGLSASRALGCCPLCGRLVSRFGAKVQAGSGFGASGLLQDAWLRLHG